MHPIIQIFSNTAVSIILELCESLSCYHFHYVLQCMFLLRTYVENVKHIFPTCRLGVH